MNGLLTTREAAKMAHVHINTIHNWIKNGTLKGYKFHDKGRWRIRKDDLESLLKEGK